MVETQLSSRDIVNPRVLEAMTRVPREVFVPEIDVTQAFDDCPLSIGEGQTISQPYMVAKAAEELLCERNHRVLEIGAGCGYQAAVLSELVSEVFAVEWFDGLAARARNTLYDLGIGNVTVLNRDGKGGVPEAAPFDRILASCAVKFVPRAWHEQLKGDGFLVAPLVVDERGRQILCRLRPKPGGDWTREALCPVRYVPLL
jgi:protein-L-isoaspartate(D-aspartate) O-methyltransferase